MSIISDHVSLISIQLASDINKHNFTWNAWGNLCDNMTRPILLMAIILSFSRKACRIYIAYYKGEKSLVLCCSCIVLESIFIYIDWRNFFSWMGQLSIVEPVVDWYNAIAVIIYDWKKFLNSFFLMDLTNIWNQNCSLVLKSSSCCLNEIVNKESFAYREYPEGETTFGVHTINGINVINFDLWFPPRNIN